MAITNFIPELWSATSCWNSRRTSLRFRREPRLRGDIANYGDTVHITGIAHISIGDYTAHTDITIEPATDKDAGELVINQSKYFAFEIDDVEKRQAMNNLTAAYSRDAAYKLRDLTDQYLAGLMAAGAKSKLDPISGATATKAYDTIVDLATALDKQNVPDAGRWVIVNPDFYGLLRKDSRFVAGAESAHSTLLNGVVGEAAGMTILKSNNAPAAKGGSTSAQTDEATSSSPAPTRPPRSRSRSPRSRPPARRRASTTSSRACTCTARRSCAPKRWPPYTSRWASDGRQL